MGSDEQRVPKKARTANKFCQHCKTNGGPYTTHNNKECRKYNKDGKAVAATAGKPYEKKPYKKNGGGSDKQMAYLTATIESLVKKGIKKAGKKKRKKRSYESSSSNSDSEQEYGYSDTGLHLDKRLKLDKQLALNLMSTEPRPIKVTNLADEIISSNEKAIENAKTGKVTAVAAVMYLDKNNKSNLRSANQKKQ